MRLQCAETLLPHCQCFHMAQKQYTFQLDANFALGSYYMSGQKQAIDQCCGSTGELDGIRMMSGLPTAAASTMQRQSNGQMMVWALRTAPPPTCAWPLALPQ